MHKGKLIFERTLPPILPQSSMQKGGEYFGEFTVH